MAYFPMFIDLKEKNCFIVGGGLVAYRKAKTLTLYGANLIVIAPSFIEELKEMGSRGEAILIKKEISIKDKEDFLLTIKKEEIILVIGATNQKEVNEAIGQWCQEEKIPVNVVDNQELCTFLFPAVVTKDKVSIGITTSGTSPSASAYLRERIEEMVDEEFLTLVEEMGTYRTWLKAHVKSEEERRACLRKKVEEWKQGRK